MIKLGSTRNNIAMVTTIRSSTESRVAYMQSIPEAHHAHAWLGHLDDCKLLDFTWQEENFLTTFQSVCTDLPQVNLFFPPPHYAPLPSPSPSPLPHLPTTTISHGTYANTHINICTHIEIHGYSVQHIGQPSASLQYMATQFSTLDSPVLAFTVTLVRGVRVNSVQWPQSSTAYTADQLATLTFPFSLCSPPPPPPPPLLPLPLPLPHSHNITGHTYIHKTHTHT